jgi:hypothetical protein
MSRGKDVRSRLFRWTSIRVSDSGTDNTAVVEELARWLGDKQLCFTQVNHIGPQSVQVEYSPSFNDEDRLIIYEEIKKKWPKAQLCFYGEEALTILRSATCLDKYIQGSDS